MQRRHQAVIALCLTLTTKCQCSSIGDAAREHLSRLGDVSVRGHSLRNLTKDLDHDLARAQLSAAQILLMALGGALLTLCILCCAPSPRSPRARMPFERLRAVGSHTRVTHMHARMPFARSG